MKISNTRITCCAVFLSVVFTVTVAAVVLNADRVFAQQSRVKLPSNVPLPEDLKVVSPKQDTPHEFARFSGKWFGVWDGNVLEHIFVVEEVDQTGAKAIYAFGTAPSRNIHQPRWFRVSGKFIKGALVVETPRATITYKMNNDVLDATFESKETPGPGGHSTARLLRAE